MTDRELLELAAKAAGKTHYGEYSPNGGLKTTGGWWNPLTDDGDALRLAVKLGMDLSLWGTDVFAKKGSKALGQVFSGDDRHAATRRAIVRAAAEIGKEMQG
jgi:hypothetical protein